MKIFTWAGLVVLVDQLSKWLACQNLWLGESFPVISGAFHITLIYNTGAAFGLFLNQTIFFVVISIIAVLFIISFLVSAQLSKGRKSTPFLTRFCLALILGGAIGNLIDRLRFGYVVDFLDFRIWPVFNLADSAITLGAIFLIWRLIIGRA